MSEPGKIYQAIAGMLRDVDAIAKTKRNEQQRFMFRGVDDVYNAVHPILAKHGVFITTEVENETRENLASKSGSALYSVRLKCRFRFWAEDGSHVSSVIVGEAMDSGDKATNKALSVAYKYALFQILCIPTEETAIDPDAHTHEPAAAKEPRNGHAKPAHDAPPTVNADGLTQPQAELTARLIMRIATMKMSSVEAAITHAEKSAADLGPAGLKKVRAAICDRVGKELKAAASNAKCKAELIDIQNDFTQPFFHLLNKDEQEAMDVMCNEIYAALPAGDVV